MRTRWHLNKDKRTRSQGIIVERSVEGGQGKKFWALPEEMPGKGEKK